MAKNMSERRAIVMGGTSGIGLEVVRELCRQGWQVGIAGRREEVLEQLQSEIDGVVAVQRIDITDEYPLTTSIFFTTSPSMLAR